MATPMTAPLLSLYSISLDNELSRRFTFPDTTYRVYADPGFAVGTSIITPFPHREDRTEEEEMWNQQMSSARISVEWGIGLTKEMFKRMTYKNNLRIGMSPVGIYWFNAIHLANLHTCFYGNQISRYFQIRSPNCQGYMAMIN